MQRREPAPAPELPREVRAEFFRAAAQVLLRPLPPPGQDRTSAGRTGKYMVIKRLLTLFDRYAPELASEMRAQLAALTPDVGEQFRTGENRAITVGIVPEDASRDPVKELEERLKGAADQAERYRDGVMINNVNATDFDLSGLFRGLARDDLYRAIEVAKNFTTEAPRANAHLAIARAVLEEKRK